MNKSRLLGAVWAFLFGSIIAGPTAAAPITIGPYTFSGPEAFPTDTSYVSGDTVYIEHLPGTSWSSFTGNSTTDLDAALTGYDLTLGVDGSGIVVDLTFGNATILNADGADLVVFETVFEENFDIAVYTGDTLSSPQTYWSVDTGLTVGGVVGTTNTAMLNAIAIDLSDFGIGLGETVSKIRLYTQPVGVPPEDSTAGADIVTIGALHVAVTVTIDIKPSKKPENVISLKKDKNLTVAIVGDASFDALQVDPSTVMFGPSGASPVRFKGQDYNRDGYSDLILTFKLSETGIGTDCTVTEATLTGETAPDAIEIQGTDSFTIEGCP